MASRIISPPREEWENLPTPLTDGERQVGEFFDRHLPAGWEIYVQPHLNGLQPDFVLLHPDIGVAVYEVKDWNPVASIYEAHHTMDGPTLRAWYPGNVRPNSLVGKHNPFLRVREYKDYIHSICTSAVRGGPNNVHVGYGRITAGLVFTVGRSRFWKDLSSPFKSQRDPAPYYPVVGEDALRSGRIGWVFPEANNPKKGLMTEEVANLLRGWLREPDFSRQQRLPLPMNQRQNRLVYTAPGSTGLRRMRGPAGSGKSLVLAARAAVLAAAGNRVLVVGFNITLSNYLRDLSVRHLRTLLTDKTAYRSAYRRMIFTHYHEWQRWGKSYEEGEEFDAILVDEGNDFNLPWWHEMHSALKSGGEMTLAFDQTQDIYRRAGAWTEDAMQGAGFNGPWNELRESYRCHEGLVPALRHFTDVFMPDTEANLPVPAQSELPQFYPLTLRWVQIVQNSDWTEVCMGELLNIQNSLPQDAGYSDIVCMLPEHWSGFDFADRIERTLGIRVAHTFSNAPDSELRQRQSRPLKRAFWGGNGQIKATTIHSFKGWEARYLLIYIDDVWKTSAMPALFYTALTRLLRHEGGSSLTVVSSCPALRDFGQRFFDDFVELPNAPLVSMNDLPF